MPLTRKTMYTNQISNAELLETIERNLHQLTLCNLQKAAVGDLVLVENFDHAESSFLLRPVDRLGRTYLTVGHKRYARDTGNVRRAGFTSRNVPQAHSVIYAPMAMAIAETGQTELERFINKIKADEQKLDAILLRIRIEQMMQRPGVTIELLKSVFNLMVSTLP